MSEVLRKRIKKIEMAFRRIGLNDKPKDYILSQKIKEALTASIVTMSTEHQQQFERELKVWTDTGFVLDRKDAPDAPFTDVFRVIYTIVSETVLRHRHNSDAPWYFGPEVFDSYREGKTALLDCEDCGCEYPVRLDKCRLCGGEIGWYAYSSKHGYKLGAI